jgi:hypothetical protein
MLLQSVLRYMPTIAVLLGLAACGGGGGGTPSFQVSATITGITGSGLVIQLNGANDITVSSNGSVTFSTPILSGSPFSVTVKSQPTNPWQTCVVSPASGTVTAPVSTSITCTINTYSVGGSVSGLAGNGLTLQNNSGDDLVISQNGSFSFKTLPQSGSSYSVSIKNQPTSLIQSCVISNASGKITDANITSVGVKCETPLPVITSQPTAATVFETQSATFSVSATDVNGGLRYQWKKNGADISGATSSTYTVGSAAIADNGSKISANVIGPGGATSSIEVAFNVKPGAPLILTQPTPKSVVAGQIAQFSVTADGLPGFTYQWFKNGARITGANQSTYSAPATLRDNNAKFTVSVANTLGSVTSSGATLTVQAASLGDLVISEVSNCFFSNVTCWFEIYNPTATAIDLSAYRVRSSSVPVSGGSVGVSEFSLPAVRVASDDYVIVSGNVRGEVQRGQENLLVRTSDSVPFWQSTNGFVEITKGGTTVDYIVLGGTYAPTTPAAWTGGSLNGLAPGSSTGYGRSVVRPYPRTTDTDTNSASDWIAVDWVTPAGRNDVPANTSDTDNDGIPDSAEVLGGTYAGIDLYSMGARTSQPDILIEVDYMDSVDPGVIPRREALQKVVDAFAEKKIRVHFDVGGKFSSTFAPQDFNLGQSTALVPFEKCVAFSSSVCTSNVSNRRTLFDWKHEFMAVNRRSVFHYLLFGSTQLASGAEQGSSGIAELNGNDLIITLGGGYFKGSEGIELNRAINLQASTVMHELGHNLGLSHGGNEDRNYKPNYWSVMNYLYQLRGLDPDPQSITAYQRWRLDKGDKLPRECSLVASPCGSPKDFVISFSDGSSKNLDEAQLAEVENIGRGIKNGAYADWNMDDKLTSTLQSLDLDGDGARTVMKDFDDWGNLNLAFSRRSSGNAGVGSVSLKRLDPLSDDRQPYVIETLTPPDL